MLCYLPLVSPTFRPGEVAPLIGVSVDTVRRWCDSGELPTTRDDAGRRTIDGVDLAQFLRHRSGPVAASRQSARNRFPGIVTRVERDGVTALVEVQAGPHRVVSLITADAVDDLGLAPGVLVAAVVKATNVGVELEP